MSSLGHGLRFAREFTMVDGPEWTGKLRPCPGCGEKVWAIWRGLKRHAMSHAIAQDEAFCAALRLWQSLTRTKNDPARVYWFSHPEKMQIYFFPIISVIPAGFRFLFPPPFALCLPEI